MEEKKGPASSQQTAGRSNRGEAAADQFSLNHGVPSLVATDNPDDSDLEAAIQRQKRGSRR